MVDESMALGIIRGVRKKYPTPLAEKHAEFLLETAAACQAGLLIKPTGTHIVLPDGTPVAQDIIMDGDRDIHYDILSDGEGAADPVFNSDGPMDHARFYKVVPTDAPVDSPVPPVVTPTPPSDGGLVGLVAQMHAILVEQAGKIAALEAANTRQDEDLVNQIRGMQSQVTSIAERSIEIPPLEVKVSLFGLSRTFPVTVKQ